MLTLNTQYVTGYDPVYNPINYIISSDSSAYLNYKYVFNLYSGATTSGPVLSTIRLNPRPDGSCQYNPARILESISTADLLIANITGSTPSQNSLKQYTIEFDEQFGGNGVYSFRFKDTLYMNTGPYINNTALQIEGYNPFKVGDLITVVQDTQAFDISGNSITYNGNYTILALSGGTYPVINITFTSTTINPGFFDYKSGSTTYYLTGTTYTSRTFNSDLQYYDYPSWSPIPYEVSSGNVQKLFLTKQPRSGVYVKNETDRGTLSYLHLNTSGVTALNIDRYYKNGTTGSDSHLMTFPSNINIAHIPSGPWNLNQAYGDDYIDVDTMSSYDIFLSDGSGALTEAITYIIDNRCSKYQTIRLQFKNSLGAWDYVNFDMLSRKTLNLTKRDTFKKILNVGYKVGDRETTIIDIDGTYTYTVTSNWMNDAQSAWMEELFLSQDVNIINSDGTSWPVNLQQNTLEIQTSLNQKMISYTFDLISAYSINGQRG